MSAAATATRLLGSGPVAGLARRLDGRLRVLAYHGVPSGPAFRAQAEHLATHYAVVSVDEVAAVARGGRPLPRRAAWLTFDDGEPSTVGNGLPVLRDLRITATMFVVPSVLGTGEPLWWHVVRAAAAAGLTGTQTEAALKLVPDPDRRREVDRLRDALGPRTWPQLDEAALTAWVDAGCSLGSHTWDHPMLDRCTGDEQARQIVEADRALDRWFGGRRTFAYPNGAWATDAERTLERLGYDLAVLHDHRLSDLGAPLRISRLRVDADAPMDRFRAIVSGAHPAGFRLATAARRTRRR